MRRYLSRMLSLIDRQTKLGLVGMLILTLVSAALEMLGVGVFLPLLQVLVDPGAVARVPLIGGRLADAAAADLSGFLIAVCLAALAIFVIKSVALAAIVYIENLFLLRRQAAFARDLLRAYLARPYLFHVEHNSAELIRNVHILSTRLFVKGLMPVLQIAMELLIAAAILIVLVTVNPLTTFAALGVMIAVAALFYALVQVRVRRWGEMTVGYDAQVLQWTQQALGSVKATQLTGTQEFFCQAVARPSFARADVMTYLNTAPYLPRLFVEIAAIAGLLILITTSLAAGGNELGAILPTIGLFGAAAARLMPGFGKIVSNLTLLRENVATIDILFEDLGGQPPLAPAQRRDDHGLAFSHELRMDGVSFTYPRGGAPALDRIDLAIARGESIALVGRSGAGKTTLADLILGLLEPTAGRVFIDGRALRGLESAWQRRIGYVPQEIYLIDDTLRRNIAFGVPDNEIDEKRLNKAIQSARLQGVVAGLPHGLDTMIGERGARLSGGQRQRIGIARALYNEPDVLIMDEATSALDSETEREIGEALLALRDGPTVIVIAHRLSTVRNCDRLVIMVNGRIADVGTFDQLLERSEEFRRLAGAAALQAPAN